jgi:hypothetical protein
MNHGPFGLSPQVFSVGFLVLFLVGGTLLSVWMNRRPKYRRTLAATAESYRAQQLPGAQPWGDLVGVWHFTSAARWAGVIGGVVLGFGAMSIPFSMVAQPALFESDFPYMNRPGRVIGRRQISAVFHRPVHGAL